MDLDVNLLAVLAGTVAHQAVGALWYAALFQNTWLKAMGKTREEIESGAGSSGLAFGAVCSLLSVFALAMIVGLLDSPSMLDGVLIGGVAGLGFVGAATFMNGFYEQKSPVLSLLFGSYYTVGLMVAGGIIGAWR